MLPGWGIDADVQRRPGVPSHADPPAPAPGVTYREPTAQTSSPWPLVGPLRRLTPVYSTAIPPHGPSGWIRRMAYRVPDHYARRWLLLLTADRVDAFQHARWSRLALGATVLTALGFWVTRRA